MRRPSEALSNAAVGDGIQLSKAVKSLLWQPGHGIHCSFSTAVALLERMHSNMGRGKVTQRYTADLCDLSAFMVAS